MKNNKNTTLADRVSAFQKQEQASIASDETIKSSKAEESKRRGREWALNTSDIARLERLSAARKHPNGAYLGEQWDRAIERLWRDGITESVDSTFAEAAVEEYDKAIKSLA